MPLNPPPLPLTTELVTVPDRDQKQFMQWDWAQYFTFREQRIQESSTRIVDTLIENQGAAIGATALDVGTAAAAYRVSSLLRVTQPASVSSSVQLTLGWTTGGQALTKAYTALTGNAVTTFSMDTLPVRVDANSSLTYTITYATSGATAMLYSVEFIVERIG